MADTVPPHLMNPQRLEWARSLGLAQRLAVDAPPTDEVPQTTAPVAANNRLALVAEPISGRDWIVLQVPGGQVRWQGDKKVAFTEARDLAVAEGAHFAVFRPVIAYAPVTEIREETFDR